MTTTPTENPPQAASPEKPESRLGFVAAILLGVAATLTAISSYQAALKDGEALEGYSTSNLALADANYFYNLSNQEVSRDTAIFIEFVQARTTEDATLEANIQNLMSQNLSDAVAWWDVTDEAVTPFDELEGNPYVNEALPAAEEQSEAAQTAYDDGAQADAVGDAFELATVFLAMTLFFGGIATLFRRRSLTVTMLSFATISLALGGLRLATAFAS